MCKQLLRFDCRSECRERQNGDDTITLCSFRRMKFKLKMKCVTLCLLCLFIIAFDSMAKTMNTRSKTTGCLSKTETEPERVKEKRIKLAFNLIIANSKWVFWTNEMHPDKRNGIETHRVFPTRAHIQNIGYCYALQTVSLKCVARWMCHSPFIVHIISIIPFMRTGYVPLVQFFFQILEFFSSLLHSSFCVISFLCVLVQGQAHPFSQRILSNHSNKLTLHWAMPVLEWLWVATVLGGFLTLLLLLLIFGAFSLILSYEFIRKILPNFSGSNRFQLEEC